MEQVKEAPEYETPQEFKARIHAYRIKGEKKEAQRRREDGELAK